MIEEHKKKQHWKIKRETFFKSSLIFNDWQTYATDLVERGGLTDVRAEGDRSVYTL